MDQDLDLNQDWVQWLSSEAEMPLTHRMDQDHAVKLASLAIFSPISVGANRIRPPHILNK